MMKEEIDLFIQKKSYRMELRMNYENTTQRKEGLK